MGDLPSRLASSALRRGFGDAAAGSDLGLPHPARGNGDDPGLPRRDGFPDSPRLGGLGTDLAADRNHGRGRGRDGRGRGIDGLLRSSPVRHHDGDDLLEMVSEISLT